MIEFGTCLTAISDFEGVFQVSEKYLNFTNFMTTVQNNLHLTLMFANKLLKGLLLTPIFCLVLEIQILLDMCYFTGIMNFLSLFKN